MDLFCVAFNRMKWDNVIANILREQYTKKNKIEELSVNPVERYELNLLQFQFE